MCELSSHTKAVPLPPVGPARIAGASAQAPLGIKRLLLSRTLIHIVFECVSVCVCASILERVLVRWRFTSQACNYRAIEILSFSRDRKLHFTS